MKRIIMKKTMLILALLTLGTNAADFSICKDYEKGVDRLRCYDNIADNMTKDSEENNVKPVEGIIPFIDFSFHPESHAILNTVRMHLGYKNNTKKTIVGVIVKIKVTDVFGDTLLEVDQLKDDVKINPGKRYKTSKYRKFSSSNSVYQKLWSPVNLDTYKTEVTVTKVIFKDGTTLGK